MVEHADIIDTELLHEPKGILESTEGEVYISDNDEDNNNPTGHWGKLPISSLDFTPEETTTQTYDSFPTAGTLTSSIVGTPTGVVSEASSFGGANQNVLELYTAIDNLFSRMLVVESNLAKVQALLSDVDAALKTIGFLAEEE